MTQTAQVDLNPKGIWIENTEEFEEIEVDLPPSPRVTVSCEGKLTKYKKFWWTTLERFSDGTVTVKKPNRKGIESFLKLNYR